VSKPEVRSTFRAATIASGLVTQEHLREAEQAIRAELNVGDVKTKIDDDQLIGKLLELGRLNKWQVEQLKHGQTQFRLGDYLVTDSIGRGGMGEVYKAVHTMMGRVEAIKVLPQYKSTPTAIASFTREIRAQAQMDHPNLVRASYAGHHANVYYLVTEYVPGTDLRKFVRARQRLTMNEAATIISQAAKGLAYAHSRGMIHRDIKPGNLLVTPDGQTKVSDLGLAGFLNEGDGADPRAGKTVGTADYLAPELIQDPKALSPAVDVYSLGCTLYYAVTGKVPFPGGTTREKALRHIDGNPLKPSRINSELSDEFVEVIAAMMEKDPAKRIQTAVEVVERLAPWVRDAVANAVTDAARGPIPPDRAITPSEIAETDSGFLYGDEVSGSGSQSSQGTGPMAVSVEETLPDPIRRKIPFQQPARVPNVVVVLTLGPLIAMSMVLFVCMLLKAI
jgi:serine/threonine protein kinase